MKTGNCGNELLTGLIELLMFGAKHNYIEPTERLLAAVHLMRPGFIELRAYDAWILIRQRRFSDAVRLLRELEQQPLRGSFGPYVSSLLAICLANQNDESWRHYANEVMSGKEDADSIELMTTLMGQAGDKTAKRPPVAQIDKSQLQFLLQRRHLRA